MKKGFFWGLTFETESWSLPALRMEGVSKGDPLLGESSGEDDCQVSATALPADPSSCINWSLCPAAIVVEVGEGVDPWSNTSSSSLSNMVSATICSSRGAEPPIECWWCMEPSSPETDNTGFLNLCTPFFCPKSTCSPFL